MLTNIKAPFRKIRGFLFTLSFVPTVQLALESPHLFQVRTFLMPPELPGLIGSHPISAFSKALPGTHDCYERPRAPLHSDN